MFTCVCSLECCTSMSTADDGGIADFLKDLFTTATSITVFVVVIMFPVSGPCIIITSLHLASMNHYCFLGFLQSGSDSTHIYTEVYGAAFLNIIVTIDRSPCEAVWMD